MIVLHQITTFLLFHCCMGFGDFLDILDGDKVIPDWDGMKKLVLQQAVDDFARKMCD